MYNRYVVCYFKTLFLKIIMDALASALISVSLSQFQKGLLSKRSYINGRTLNIATSLDIMNSVHFNA